jgi:hypothetical protein
VNDKKILESKIDFFDTDDEFTIYYEENEYDSITMKKNGFSEDKILYPFYFIGASLDFISISIWNNPEKKIDIIELVDCTGLLFSFAARNGKEKLRILKEYLSIAKDICEIQKILKDLEQEDQK